MSSSLWVSRTTSDVGLAVHCELYGGIERERAAKQQGVKVQWIVCRRVIRGSRASHKASHEGSWGSRMAAVIVRVKGMAYHSVLAPAP